jgi:hypothetical protein
VGERTGDGETERGGEREAEESRMRAWSWVEADERFSSQAARTRPSARRAKENFSTPWPAWAHGAGGLHVAPLSAEEVTSAPPWPSVQTAVAVPRPSRTSWGKSAELSGRSARAMMVRAGDHVRVEGAKVEKWRVLGGVAGAVA